MNTSNRNSAKKQTNNKNQQWKIDDQLQFSGDTLEPRVLLNALAVADVAEVEEDAVFSSVTDGLNGGGDTSVKDNDSQIPFTSGGPDDFDVNEDGLSDLNSQLGLPFTSQPLDFNADGTFAFDGTGSDVIQSLSEGEVGQFEFQYYYVGQTELGSEARETVTLNVNGANDEFEVDFGGPNYNYVANGNAVHFADPLVQIEDVDANDYYEIELVVAPANPNHPGPLGMLYLESEGYGNAGGTLLISGSLDEVNAQLLEVCYKPANIDYADDLDPYKLKQHIDITVSEFAGGTSVSPTATNVETSIAVLEAEVDVAGAVVFNHYPETANDSISFNENSLIDFKTGNVLDNDSDPEDDPISLTELRFDGTPGVAEANTVEGNDYDFKSVGDFGTLYYNADGSYIYVFDDNVDYLAFGEQEQDVFEYDIIDSAWNESKLPGTLTVAINGAKDAPEFAQAGNGIYTRPDTGETDIITKRQAYAEQTDLAPLVETFNVSFSDVDISDLHDVQIKGVYLEGDVPPGKSDGDYKTEGTYFDFLSFGDVDNDDATNRKIPFTFEADSSALDYLDGGDELFLYYEVCVTDPKDCTATAFIRIKITGTEDKPVLYADNKGVVTEGDPGDDPITDTGFLFVDGIDENDDFTFSNPDNAKLGTYGSLNVVVDENGVESWEYVLNNESPLVQMLNEGEQVEDNFYLTVYDENGQPVLDPNFADSDEPVYCTVHVCICITGTDDEPTADGDMMVWVSEGDIGSPTEASGIISASDIDSLDNPTFVTNALQPGSGTAQGTYGAIIGTVLVDNPDYDPLDPESGPEQIEVWTYVPDQTLIQHLAKGEILEDSVTLTAYDYSKMDEYGNVVVEESVSKTIIIKIKGTNDAPEVTSDEVTIWEDPDKDTTGVGLTTGGTLDVADVDLSDEVVIYAKPDVGSNILRLDTTKGSPTEGEYLEVPNWRDIDAYAGVDSSDVDANQALLDMLNLPTSPVVEAGADTGVSNWTFDSGVEGFDFLAEGEKLVLVFSVCVEDSCGETAESTITITILGKNDRPDIYVGPHDSAMEMSKENFGSLEGNGYTATGTLSVTDPDASDFVTGSNSFGQGVTGVVVESTFPIPPDTGLDNDDFLNYFNLIDADTVIGTADTEGVIEWSFDTNGEDFDFLGVGEELVLTYTVSVADHHGCADTQEVVIKIKGTNDRPTLKNNLPKFDRGYAGSSADAIDANDFYNNGTLVSDLLEAQQEDVDVNGSKQGIVVQGVDFSYTTTGADDWEYSTDGGATWTAFDADLSSENATVLGTDARLRFVPDNAGENSGWAKLKFSLWDQTDGNPSGTTGVDSTELFVYDADDEPCGESAYGQRMLWFTVQVNAPAADGPTAVADNYTVMAGSTTLLGSVLDNDIDPDSAQGDLIASLLAPTPGVTMSADGNFLFDASGLAPGESISFQYLVSDGTDSSVGTVTIIADAVGEIAGPAEVVTGKGGTYTPSPGSLGGLGTIVSETWTVDGVVVSTDSSFDFTPTELGTFELGYTAVGTSGAIATQTLTVTAVPAAIIGGDLVIGGTNGDDLIIVNPVGSNFRVTINGTVYDFAQADVTGKIIICGLDGDDDLRVSPGITLDTEIYGNAGNDAIYGGAGNDLLDGGDGDDSIFGRTGDDVILGGDGNDTGFGHAGNDVLDGGDGIDALNGGLGDDEIDGGLGNDEIFGGLGNDIIDGGDGNDFINAGGNDDNVSGGAGDDEILGTTGNDTIDGGEGNDRVLGGSGDDVVSGGEGDDTLYGNGGVDEVYGELGNDFVSGGANPDIVDGGDGDDIVHGNSGNDVVYGRAGEDQVFGGADNDQVFGGDDDDLVNGQSGDDVVMGEDGDDTLTGGAGLDQLDGGAGFDTATDDGEISEISIELKL